MNPIDSGAPSERTQPTKKSFVRRLMLMGALVSSLGFGVAFGASAASTHAVAHSAAPSATALSPSGAEGGPWVP